ncbi:hypothetical protein V8B55DRAFT_1484966 [Mucor lusitanicus]
MQINMYQIDAIAKATRWRGARAARDEARNLRFKQEGLDICLSSVRRLANRKRLNQHISEHKGCCLIWMKTDGFLAFDRS